MFLSDGAGSDDGMDALGPQRVRAVTRLEVSPDEIETAIAAARTMQASGAPPQPIDRARRAIHPADRSAHQPVMYRTLDSDKIVATLEQLRARIFARFPQSSLSRVCAELTEVARENKARAARLAQPNWRLRGGVALFLLIGAVLIVYVARVVAASETPDTLFGLQGLETIINITVLVGAGVLFVVTFESRLKRSEALEDIHELRSIVHVIDMHQLTKDPTAGSLHGPDTAASPPRLLSPFELTRYLDYCSELLSLAAKVAALYAQSSSDAVVVDAVNDLERLTTNLSQKIWQKITLISESGRMSYPPGPIAQP